MNYNILVSPDSKLPSALTCDILHILAPERVISEEKVTDSKIIYTFLLIAKILLCQIRGKLQMITLFGCFIRNSYQ